jgi:outer membrane protein TolC
MRHIFFYFSFLLIALSPTLVGAAKSISFQELAISLIQSNADLITAKSQIEQSQIAQSSVYRLNVPTLSAAGGYYDATFKENGLGEDAKQKNIQFDLGLKGNFVGLGLGYNFSSSYFKQDQKAFSAFPGLKRDGRDVRIGLELNLLEDAGYLVGSIPYRTANLETRSSNANYRAVLITTIRDLLDRYLSVVLAQKKLKNIQPLLEQAEKLSKQYQALHSEGRISRIELLSAQIQVEDMRSTVLRLTKETKQNYRSLLAFSGIFDPEIGGELQPLPIDFVPNERVQSLRRTFNLKSNAQINAVEARRRVVDSESESLRNKLLPTMKIVTEQSWVKNAPPGGIINSDNSQQDQFYVGIKFEMPIDNIAASSDLNIKRVESVSLVTKQKLLEQSVQQQIRQLFDEMNLLQQELDLAVKQEQLANERYTAALPLIEKSSRSQLDIIDFQNQLQDLQFSIAEIQTDLIRKRAYILFLSGDPLVRF